MLPKVIDLFSGCGGMTLGFEKAGFEIVAGIELMEEAYQTISYNLSWRKGKESTHLCGDITKIDSNVFKNRIGSEGCIIIGGPPCQAYSMAGKGKLNSLGKDRSGINDARGYLYQDFLRFVFDMDTRAVIMENVPESTNFGGNNIPEIVCQELEKNGFNSYWTILNSANYGVPQVRERVFVIGIKKDEKLDIKLPLPSHMNIENVKTSGEKRIKRFSQFAHFKEPAINAKLCKPWVTVGEAFSDLPSVFKKSRDKYKKIPLDLQMEYRTKIENDFQSKMREWYGKDMESVTGNGFRNNKRDFPIFEKMEQGDNFIAASIIADKLFEEEINIYGYDVKSEEYKKLYKKIVPPANRSKFENKWRKLEENRTSHTLVAHLEKDTYSHLHPWEPRGITVREAARLQSFPDDFFFKCSMGNAFKQIGNAVPPLLSYSIAKEVYESFTRR